jgi:SAM domain (Sterile alpha motif)
VRDVSAWLRGLGLGQYASAFEHNQIDADSLPYLTDSMLERIGLPVGPRVKLLAAISELAPRLAAGPQTGLDESRAERSSDDKPSAGRSPSCSATSSTRRGSQDRSTPRISDA